MDGQSSGVLHSAIFSAVLLLLSMEPWITALLIHCYSLQLYSFLNFWRCSYTCKWYFHLAALLVSWTPLPKIFSYTHLSHSLHTLNLTLPIATIPPKCQFHISTLKWVLNAAGQSYSISIIHYSPTLLHNYFLPSLLTSKYLLLSLSWWSCFLFQWQNWSNQ